MSDEEKKVSEEQTEATEAAADTPAEETKAETPAETAEEKPAEETKAEETPAEPEAEAAPEVEDPKAQEAKDEEDTSDLPAEEVKKELLNQHVRPGMVVRVHETIKDVSPKGEERTRTQIFEGTVLGLGGKGMGRTMTVRKVSKGYGVEKIFPLNAPTIEKVEVVKQYKVRRAKLGFLKGVIKRGRVKKRFRRKLKEIKNDK